LESIIEQERRDLANMRGDSGGR